MIIKISAVLIVKNEEQVIGRCLRSLTGLDEIVVLDTGSSDRTVEICEHLGARVLRAEPVVPFHFADARNRALEAVRTPWTFTIDADEVLRPGGARKIRKAIEEAADRTAFFVTFISQPERGAVQDTRVRTVATRKVKLFQKDAWTWKYRVHEQLVATRAGGVGDLSAVSVEHLPEPDKSRRRAQNVDLLRICVQENPEYTRAFRHLGLELMLQEKWLEALPYLTHYVEKTDEGPLETSAILTRIGCCLGNMGGRLDEALVWFERAYQADPRRREPLFVAAMYLMAVAQDVPTVERAIGFIERLLAIPAASRPESSNDWPAAWGDQPHKMLAVCRKSIGQLQLSS